MYTAVNTEHRRARRRNWQTVQHVQFISNHLQNIVLLNDPTYAIRIAGQSGEGLVGTENNIIGPFLVGIKFPANEVLAEGNKLIQLVQNEVIGVAIAGMIVIHAVGHKLHATTDILREVQIFRAFLVFRVLEVVLDEAVVQDV